MMFWKKKSKLTMRERAIRSYLLNEHAKTVCMEERCSTMYAYGREEEAREILGKVMDILGG